MSKVTEPVEAETVTMTPFSCKGPMVCSGGGGASRVDSFQLVPEMESLPLNLQPCKLRMAAPVTVMNPSQLVGALSPTPKMTRYDWAGGTVRVAA